MVQVCVTLDDIQNGLLRELTFILMVNFGTAGIIIMPVNRLHTPPVLVLRPYCSGDTVQFTYCR